VGFLSSDNRVCDLSENPVLVAVVFIPGKFIMREVKACVSQSFRGLLIGAAVVCIQGLFPQGMEARDLSWKLKNVSRQPIEKGLDQVQFTARKNDTQVRLALAFFRATDFELIVIDNGRDLSRPRYASLARALMDQGCVAGMNGSLFSREEGKPKGLVVADGKRMDSFDPHALLDACLVVREGKLSLVPIDTFRLDDKVTQLLQSNPWLVHKGVAASPEGERRSLRTFVATDGESGWILGHARHCTLRELAGILASEDFQKIHPVQDAINLDGGSSSGLWIRGNGSSPLYWKESTTVLNFIGIRRIPELK